MMESNTNANVGECVWIITNNNVVILIHGRNGSKTYEPNKTKIEIQRMSLVEYDIARDASLTTLTKWPTHLCEDGGGSAFVIELEVGY
jgi:hypothetical protein